MRHRYTLFAALAVSVALSLQITLSHAQTPPGLPWTVTIQQLASPDYAGCLQQINARENPWGSLNQPNLQGSGATGLFQILPTTWASTPPARRGISLWSASAAEQVEAASYLLATQGTQPWTPSPC